LIRKAEKPDLNSIVAIWTEISLNEFSRYIGRENVEHFIDSGELKNECERLLSNTYVLTRDSIIKGYVVIIEDLIELLVVRPEFQNAFAGKRLYDFAVNKIGESFDCVRVECFEDNARVNSILKRLGYDKDGNYRDEMGFITNRLSKKLHDKNRKQRYEHKNS
jgi:ribosomal protein S18 acetylase RimI-like enzyme